MRIESWRRTRDHSLLTKRGMILCAVHRAHRLGPCRGLRASRAVSDTAVKISFTEDTFGCQHTAQLLGTQYALSVHNWMSSVSPSTVAGMPTAIAAYTRVRATMRRISGHKRVIHTA